MQGMGRKSIIWQNTKATRVALHEQAGQNRTAPPYDILCRHVVRLLDLWTSDGIAMTGCARGDYVRQWRVPCPWRLPYSTYPVLDIARSFPRGDRREREGPRGKSEGGEERNNQGLPQFADMRAGTFLCLMRFSCCYQMWTPSAAAPCQPKKLGPSAAAVPLPRPAKARVLGVLPPPVVSPSLAHFAPALFITGVLVDRAFSFLSGWALLRVPPSLPA